MILKGAAVGLFASVAATLPCAAQASAYPEHREIAVLALDSF